ncbi:hypothetical protein JCM3775_000944 [Rhodotorula graminis]|uniref:Uncharacterized protein n=1 Tax=Rhodotorula graminis (strain WP1) TaxID=578459 RepID=A0A194S2K1_RHOGW|nr:uncharacterized protein RHOBADRAFT_53759 [Rhodotorula graminis WP1]KPV74822.1 hypothetical protein RHOBADRAFT_53759 [Rhodotorula graminis WP1]
MPRQGRQPKQLQQPQRGTPASAPPAPSTTTKQPKPASRKAAAKAAHKAATAATPDTSLDVYTHTNRVRRARGDVDPLARARSGRAAAAKGRSSAKGKGRAQPANDDDDELELEGDEEDEEDDDDEDEDASGGFRVRGDEVVEFTGLKPAGFKLGMDSDEDEARFVASDDSDEDIDSDLADEEDDDEGPLAGPSKGRAARGGNKKAAARQDKEVDLDEDEIDYDDEEGEGWMDLTEMLDAGGYASQGDDDDESQSGSDAEEEDEDEDMSSAADDDDDDDDEAGALDKLDSFVEGLDSKKRKARGDGGDDDGDDGNKKKKRVVLAERTEAYPEGEFVAVKNDNGKVDLDDLLASFTDSKNPRLAGLKKSLKTLAPSSSSATAAAAAAAKVTTTNSHLKGSGPLAAPLPGRLQDKVDREAAYDQTKDETDKWNETVRRMKGQSGLGAEGARHERLTLPLMGGEGDVRRDPNAQEWSAKFQPTNDLEASVQSLLSTAQMSQADLQQQEKAALATLDPADLAARQADLRRQRDLMYRAERKAKRVAKIKSKAYRRIHRKQRERDGAGGGAHLSLADLAELDAIDGGSRVDEERTRLELQRAKERVTLKHSGKGGRWARKVDGLDGLDEERNAAIRDMVTRRDELRKKIAGVGSGDDERDEFASSDEDEDDDSMASGGEGEGDDVEAVRRRAFDELAALDAKEAALKAGDPKLKGVMNMKFMRDAMSRADRDVQREEDELRQRLEQLDDMRDGAANGGGEEEDEDEGGGAAPVSMSEQVDGNLGRMVFGPTSAAAKLASAQPATASSSSTSGPTLSSATTTKLSGPVTVGSTTTTSRTARVRPSLSNPGASSTAAADDDDAAESNPWLALASADSGAVLSRKLNKAGHGKDHSSLAKSTAKADRARAKQADAREAERDDARVELDLGAEAALAASAGAGRAGTGGKRGKQAARKGDRPQVGGALAVPAQRMDGDATDSSDEELDEEEMQAQRGKGPAAFRQRELVKEAFANDDVVADFAEEKRKEIERDAPREEDNTLPGWGAWAGKGAKKQKNARKFVTKVAGVDAAKRKDAQLGHVIISEKKDKKVAKYMLKDLPFPYTSAAQHEHKLATPLGPEWSTSTILRDQTIPAVLVKPGVTIRPVDRKI